MIGQSVPLIHSLERVTGSIPYTINLELPGMLVGRVLRSTQPHARLRRVDASRAERLPGVLAVLTGRDLAERTDIFPYFGPVIEDQPVVAIDKVRFVGDPVAAVAAVDEDTAAEALDLIEVEYESLPAVFDAEEALRPGAPILHERFPGLAERFADVILKPEEGSNVCNRFALRHGDVGQGFREADLVVEDVYRSPPVYHVPLEPHATLAQVVGGQVTVWSSTQTPHVVRAQLAGVFRAPLARVRVIVPTLGGGFGAKCYPKLEPLAAVLAWKARRPVKLVLPRAEDFLTVSKHGVSIHLKTGVRRDGTLLARQATCYFNAGAYADISPRLIKNGGFATNGPYRIPHVWIDSYAVYTNIVPAGAFRGYGVSQAAWAYESQLDRIAAELSIDPLELRLRNVLRDGDEFATGEVLTDLHYPALLGDAAQAIGWGSSHPPAPSPAEQERGRKENPLPRSGRGTGPQGQGEGSPTRRRGKGLACVIKATVTPSTSSAAVKLNEDGSLSVLTSSVEMGQGARTALAQIAADVAGLPLERISISDPDTDTTPYDQQTSSSRTTFSMGRAVTLAVEDMRRQLCALAAEQLETAVEDLVVADGRVALRGAPDRSLAYAEVVRRARRGNLIGQASFVTEGGLDEQTGQGIGSVHWHQAAAACEVEVDTETGRIEVLRFHASAFAGRMINPRQCELQTEGSTFMGLGQALFEEMQYDNGQLTNASVAEHMVPSFEDLPSELSVRVLEKLGTDEVHGIGETSLPPVMPAVANAVYAAVGVRIRELPLTPERVLLALNDK